MIRSLLIFSLIGFFFAQNLGKLIWENHDRLINTLMEQIQITEDMMLESFDSDVQRLFATGGFDKFEQCAQIQKMEGIRDDKFQLVLKSLITRLDLPIEHTIVLQESLLSLPTEDSNDIVTLRFLYEKKSTNSTNYACFVAYHNNVDKKVNMLFTQIDTNYKVSEKLMVVWKNFGNSGSKIDIINQPKNLKIVDIELILGYFHAVATKTFGKYFGIEVDFDTPDALPGGD